MESWTSELAVGMDKKLYLKDIAHLESIQFRNWLNLGGKDCKEFWSLKEWQYIKLNLPIQEKSQVYSFSDAYWALTMY